MKNLHPKPMQILILTLVALPLLASIALAQDDPVLPELQIISPFSVSHQVEAIALPSSPVFQFASSYAPDGERVTHYRTLIKKALLPDGSYADTRNDFQNYTPLLSAFNDSAWAGWQEWPADEQSVTVSYHDLPQTEPDPNDPGSIRNIFYLFAVQVMTSDGVVSIDRTYGGTVANFRVTQSLAPILAISHPILGRFVGSGMSQVSSFDLLGGIDGEFTWAATADYYGGTIESYRWGWDIADYDDPLDAGWDGPPGLGEANTHSGPIPFVSGIHTLTIQAVDSYDQMSRRIFTMTFVPVPDPSVQRPVLLIDDVFDRNSNAWPDASGTPLDNDAYRDAFWENVLAGAGGVSGFDPMTDIIDTEVSDIGIRDVVAYRSLVWTSRWVSTPNSAIARQFRPASFQGQPDYPRYVWLGSYQEQVGNVLFASERGVNAFLPESPYVMPVIFESQEGNPYGWTILDSNTPARVGFGANQAGEPAYPDMYPYRNLGLAAIDIMSPNASYYAPDGQLIRTQRKNTCASQKGITLDPDFAAAHMPGGAAFSDTIWTETAIDWRDQDPAVADDLSQSYMWSNDEFYDVDIVGRDTEVVPQDCDGERCIEPLFRSISRYDWNRQRHLEVDPTDVWPQDYYASGDIEQYCGSLALNPEQTSALTSEQVTAFVTHKFEDQKPSQAGDVVMGFDPYRFDNGKMKEALRWVLGEHFGLTMDP